MTLDATGLGEFSQQPQIETRGYDATPMVEALELDRELERNGMIGEQLAAAADELPRAALDALTMLLSPEVTLIHDNHDLCTLRLHQSSLPLSEHQTRNSGRMLGQ